MYVLNIHFYHGSGSPEASSGKPIRPAAAADTGRQESQEGRRRGSGSGGQAAAAAGGSGPEWRRRSSQKPGRRARRSVRPNPREQQKDAPAGVLDGLAGLLFCSAAIPSEDPPGDFAPGAAGGGRQGMTRIFSGRSSGGTITGPCGPFPGAEAPVCRNTRPTGRGGCWRSPGAPGGRFPASCLPCPEGSPPGRLRGREGTQGSGRRLHGETHTRGAGQLPQGSGAAAAVFGPPGFLRARSRGLPGPGREMHAAPKTGRNGAHRVRKRGHGVTQREKNFFVFLAKKRGHGLSAPQVFLR